jgi:hypothetical protein
MKATSDQPIADYARYFAIVTSAALVSSGDP